MRQQTGVRSARALRERGPSAGEAARERSGAAAPAEHEARTRRRTRAKEQLRLFGQ